MSVLIKGMEMPKTCKECDIEDEYYFCPVSNRDTDEVRTTGRHKDCPLVEVAEPHGDLIDRDEVRNTVFHHLSIKGEGNLLLAEKSVFGNIIKAKTVIEAEGGD